MSDSETLTDANGQYAFTGLRKGNYTVEISGFDEDDVAFGSTASTAELAVGESKVVPFEGTYLRTAAITGQVSVEGVGLENVTVSLQGRGEERTATTNSAGQYTFSELRSGDYSVGITNPNADEYGFEVTSKTVTIAHGETGSVPFEGILLRTATIMGTVTVEGVGGIEGVMVSIQGEGHEDERMTNAAGQFSFTELHAGDYSVGITGFDDDLYGFEETTATVTVALQGTATVPFKGTELRTAGIEGTITVEDHPIPGVTVTVTGGPKDEEHTRVTNDAGYYLVDRLHAGTYTITISDFDANEYEFVATAKTTDVALRTTATVAFQGDLLRTAGISGRVSVEGMGLDGVTVTLSGDADMTAETADGGQYAFTGLAEGDYTVAISGWDEAAYDFSMTDTEVDLAVAQDAAEVQNFDGMHTRTASVSGMMFLDEVDSDGMHTEGEPPLAMTAEMMAALQAAGIPGVPLLLQGPGINDVQVGFTNPDGSYAFGGLTAGSYRVLINMDAEGLAEAISHFGFRFSGELTGQVVNVAAAAEETVNFPFRIVIQTIAAGAVMGNAEMTGLPVAGVSLVMYPTAEDADDGTNALGSATTDEMGGAVFHFPRAMDLGPGGQGTDHLVFIKVASTGMDNLAVSDNANIEVEYAAVDRVSQAPTAVRLLNTMANFQWWVKSNADARDGNEFLEGWKATDGAGGMETDEDGLASYTATVDVADLPATFTVKLDEDGQPDSDERWTQSAALTHTHTGLEHPAMNMSEMNDLGPVYVTWTTQKLTLGVYREADDVEGYTDYQSALPGGDHRPHADVGEGMTVELLTRDDRNRLRLYDEWDHDCDDDGEEEDPTEAKDARGDFEDGMVTFDCLPAGEEFTVRYRAGSGRMQLDYGYDEIETFGDDLADFGMTVGAFGDMSGGQPEVRLCSASAVDTTDEWCATFAYQWETGMVHGNVGAEGGHEVTVDPETTGHGAIGDEVETLDDNPRTADNEAGTYSIGGLQDGVYTASAASGDADYRILGPAAVKGIALYHNEACWADPDPDNTACSEDELVEGTDADGNTTYSYSNASEQIWNTGRLGMSIKGYVANDGQDGEDRDGLLRGDESKAGVTMRLWNSAGTSRLAETDTDASGFYSFDDLAAGSYLVQAAGPPSNAVAIVNISRHPRTGAWRYVNSKPATAQDYPAFPDEADLPKPYWDRANTAGGAMGQPTTTYTVGEESATLYNFALVYTDGELSGKVNNLSGSSGSIDIIISSPSPLDGDQKVETSSSGNFELGGLIEAIGYTAVIEDAGFASPCMDAAGMPDDDLEQDDGTCNDGTNTTDRFPTELTADIEGENDHESLGTLTVYNERLSAADGMTAVEVMGQVAIGADEVDLGDGVVVTQNTTDPTTAITLSNTTAITYSSASVTVDGTISAGASQVAMNGTEACAGGECELTYNATGSAGAGGAPPDNTITVMVTAANGYNDHAYTFTVTRANPVDNVPEGLSADDGDANTTETVGFTATETVWTLSADAGATVEINFDFKTVDYPADHALAGDAMWCQTATVTDGGTDLAAKDAARGDECDGMRFDVEMPGTATHERDVTVKITSEDGVVRTTFIRLTAT